MKSESGSDSTVGKYCCPECACKFDKPNVLYVRARWYRPDRVDTQCPHCGCLLRDRVSVFVAQPVFAMFCIGMASGVLFFRHDWDWLRAISVVLFLFLFVDALFTLRHIRSEHRYAAAKRQKP